MKFYPQKDYSKDEIRRGIIFCCADVKCHDCQFEMPLAVANSTDNGKCIKCGGKTS